MIFITPNYFLIRGPSPPQLAATHNSKGQFHNTWQRALPWHNQWPSAERNSFLGRSHASCWDVLQCENASVQHGLLPQQRQLLFSFMSLLSGNISHIFWGNMFNWHHCLLVITLCYSNISLPFFLVRFKSDPDVWIIFLPIIASVFSSRIVLDLRCSSLFLDLPVCLLYWFSLYLAFTLHAFSVLCIRASLVARWSPGALWCVVPNTGCQFSAGNNKNIPLGAGRSLDRRCLCVCCRLALKSHCSTYCYWCGWFSVLLPGSAWALLAQHTWHTSSVSVSLVAFK